MKESIIFFLGKYKIRIFQIKLIETCIKSVNKGNWENAEDKMITLTNYYKALKRLKAEKGLFTKVY